eukprot:COSAG01_NODE_4423_length_5036_cov_22.765445_6_plen_192_part_00
MVSRQASGPGTGGRGCRESPGSRRELLAHNQRMNALSIRRAPASTSGMGGVYASHQLVSSGPRTMAVWRRLACSAGCMPWPPHPPRISWCDRHNNIRPCRFHRQRARCLAGRLAAALEALGNAACRWGADTRRARAPYCGLKVVARPHPAASMVSNGWDPCEYIHVQYRVQSTAVQAGSRTVDSCTVPLQP